MSLGRIWVDGCFDLMHYGHANALRQAKEMGDYLVVGVHSDEEIRKHKGIPVMNEEERYLAVAACKWVDEVVRDAPYVTQLDMMDKYDCQFCVHGDDISMAADGSDSYQAIKDAGRFKECKRTASVSTTELVGRMLLMSKSHHDSIQKEEEGENGDICGDKERRASIGSFTSGADAKSPYTSICQILPTSRRIVQFSSAVDPEPGARVVYVDGAFDLFHAGHIETLRLAKEMGDFLLVGIHDDQMVNKILGDNYPIMNLHERVLSVLSCKHVDEIIIGSPYSVTEDILKGNFNISLVVHGKTELCLDEDDKDPYRLPKQLGIFKQVEHKYQYLSTGRIVERIISRHKMYEERNRKKQAKEIAAIKATKRSKTEKET